MIKVVFLGAFKKKLPKGYKRGFNLETDNIHEVISFLGQPKFAAIKEDLDTLGAEYRLGETRATSQRIHTATRLGGRGVKLARPGKTNTLFILPCTDGDELTTAMIATAKLIAINVAASLAISAVMSFLTPKPEKGTEVRKSQQYENGVTTNKEGVVNPILAGRRVFAGGNVIEGCIKVNDSGVGGVFTPGPGAISSGVTTGLGPAGTSLAYDGTPMQDIIRGALGNKGGGKQMANNTFSDTSMNVLIALGVGEIGGVIGETKEEQEQNIFINEVPVRAANGELNWAGVLTETRNGVAGQTPITITPGVSNNFDDSVELPKLNNSNEQVYHTIAVTSPDKTLVDLRFRMVLMSTTKKGSQNPETVTLGIDYKRVNDAGWTWYGNYTRTGKTSEAITVSVPVKAPAHDTDENWQIRVYRVTPDAPNDRVQNASSFTGWTETNELDLPYDGSGGEAPTALLGISIDNSLFASGTWPQVAALVVGQKIAVPDNYDVETRTSSGDWLGGWKYEATDNPVWWFRALATGGYGLGAGLPEWLFDRYHLATLAAYCDQKVNGRFRYSLNKQFADETPTWEFLIELAKSFGAYPTWTGSEIRLVQDRPRAVSGMLNNDQVLDGDFHVESVPLGEQVNECEVQYDNPDDFYRKGTVVYRDEVAIARNKANGLGNEGRITSRVYKVGCTSAQEAYDFARAQVIRAQMQTEILSCTTNLSGTTYFPGDIVEITDWSANGQEPTGRITAIDGSAVTLDNPITFDGGASYSLHAQGPVGLIVKPIAVFATTTKTASISVPGLSVPEGTPVTVVKAGGVVPMTFEILTRKQTATAQFELTGVQHVPGFYALLDSNQPVVIPPWSSISTDAPKPTGLKARSWSQQNDVLGAQFNIEVSWDAIVGKSVKGYRLEALFPGDSTWQILYDGPATVFNVRNAQPGAYVFTVKSVNTLGATSQPFKLDYTLGSDGEGDLLPPVFLGLDDVSNAALASNIFTGKDLRVRFREELLNVGALAYQVDFILAGNAVVTKFIQQSEPEGQESVGDDEARTFSALLSYETNAAVGLTRDPIVRIRTQGADGRWSGQWLQIDAHNPAPVIAVPPVVSPQLDSVSVAIRAPADPDVSGYLMAISTVQDFDPEANLFFDSSSNAFTVTIPTTASTYWARFAAYDAFGRDGIDWTDAQAITSFNSDFTEILDQIQEVSELIDAVREGGFAKATELETLAEAALESQMLAVRETEARIDADYLNDVPLGSVVVNEIIRTDDVVETVGLIAIKAPDGQSVIFRTEKVMVANGVSIADKFEFMEAATEQAKADALEQITLTANDISAAADAKFALITTFQDYQAQAQQQFSTLSNETESLAEFDAILGAMQPNGQSIRINRDKVYVNDNQTWAQSDTLIQSQFNGTATGSNKSVLLQSSETSATKVSAHGTIFTQLGVTDLTGSTAVSIDGSKVTAGNGQNVSQRFSSVQSELSGKATSSSVSSQITAATGPGSSLASSISTAQSTANGANSLASIAYSAANGNAADIAILTVVGGRITGQKVNGATGVITFQANAVGFVSSSGGATVLPLQVVGNQVIATNFQADNVKAGSITTDSLVDNSISTPVFTSSNTTYNSVSNTTLLSASITPAGSRGVKIDFTGNFHFPSSRTTLILQLYVNGSAVAGAYARASFDGQDEVPMAITFYDNYVSAGNGYNYSIVKTQGTSIDWYSGSLYLQELKK